MISPQSIRKGITIKFDNVVVDKPTIIKASEEWKENHEILFKKLLKQGGAWYSYVDIETGEEIKFQAKDFAKLLENEELKDQIYRRICEATILLYKAASSDEVEITTDEGNESD